MPDPEDTTKFQNTTGYEVYVHFADLQTEVEDNDPAKIAEQKNFHLFLCQSQDCESMEDLHEIEAPFLAVDPL